MGGGLDVRVIGDGEPVLLVHGGVDRDETWREQEALTVRWKLLIPARRGFPPSPPAERQDFEADARDLAEMLQREPAHCVGFSYGGVGLALAAAEVPERTLSLTLVEPALFGLAASRPALQAAMTEAPLEDLARIRLPGGEKDELTFLDARRAAPPPRPPTEVDPDLSPIAAAGVPTLVVSGDHHPGHEALCDALGEMLGAERAKLSGGFHAIPRVPGFNDLLERFLTGVRR